MKKILLVLSFLWSFGLALPQVKIDIRNLRAKPKTDDVCLNECDQVLTSPLQLSRVQATSHVTVEDPQERTVDSGPMGT